MGTRVRGRLPWLRGNAHGPDAPLVTTLHARRCCPSLAQAHHVYFELPSRFVSIRVGDGEIVNGTRIQH